MKIVENLDNLYTRDLLILVNYLDKLMINKFTFASMAAVSAALEQKTVLDSFLQTEQDRPEGHNHYFEEVLSDYE